MMVIRGTLSAAAHGIPANVPHIFPADRCVWNQTYNGTARQYFVSTAFFFSGAAAAGTVIVDPQLGYIGKSGRFVEIAS